ncbi:MAG: hypothetical protein WCS84_07715 [Nocardioides sp.]
MQVDVGAVGGNFVAIGTAKGAGAPGPNSSCVDRYSGTWNVYTDGMAFGTYFCHDEVFNAYTAGDDVPFTINYGDCPGDLGARWRLYMGGNFHQCVNQGSSTGSRVSVMLETTGTSLVDRNIDVKYTGLEYLIGSWVDLENANLSPVDNFYTVTAPANGKVNAFLTPLD